MRLREIADQLGCRLAGDPDLEIAGVAGMELLSGKKCDGEIVLEPFGVAILEAMLHRLPVVATTIGAMPDMNQEGVTGHMVAPGDSQQLARTLSSMLQDPERCRRYGEAGYTLAISRYTWPEVGARFRAEILKFLRKPSLAVPRLRLQAARAADAIGQRFNSPRWG